MKRVLEQWARYLMDLRVQWLGRLGGNKRCGWSVGSG